jgi:hypothetical protein
MTVEANELEFDYSKYGFRQEENYVFKSGKGLSEDVVRGFEARWAQLDAIQRTMRTLEADRWQFKDGAIKFDDPAVQQQFAELLDELDWHAKRVELSVQSMRSKRRSRSSP